MAVFFERLSKIGESLSDFSGDGGGMLRWVEGVRVRPDGAEAVAHLRLVEIRQGDSVGDRVRKALIVATGAGELRVEVDGVSDVADDEEGRAAIFGRQCGDIPACLVVGTLEGLVERSGAAFPMAGLRGGVGGVEK